MASYPPPYPPPGYDPRTQRRFLRDQARAQAQAQKAAFQAERARMRYQMRGMRRGSILGPLVLIVVGIAFLLVQTGRLDHVRVWAWYAQYWPFLLVAAGVVVLAEWAVDQYLMRDPERPQYRRSLGGGVFLLLLIILVGAGVVGRNIHDFPNGNRMLFPGFHFDQDSMDKMFGDKHESDQTIDAAFYPGRSLVVVNPQGDVTITGTSDDNQIHVAIHKQVYAMSDADADAKAQHLAPRPSNGSGFELNLPAIDGARADLVITVPATAATTVTANHGEVHVASIKNAVSITDNHGDVELSAITGPVTARINNGGSSMTARNVEGAIQIQGHANDLTLADVHGPVTITGEFFGTTHLEHVNGPIHFHTSRTDLQYARLDGETDISNSDITSDQVMGPVVVTTSNRNVSLERLAGDVSVTNKNGTIDLTAAPVLGNIIIQDRNGAVNLTLPEKVGFTVDARTTHGDISTDYALSINGAQNAKTLSGTVDAGGPLVRVTTSNSDIAIHKGNVAAIPAMPPVPAKITLTPPSAPAKAATKAAKGHKEPAATAVPAPAATAAPPAMPTATQ